MSTSGRATPTVAWDSAADLTSLLHRRLLFVTGKGGTGKTTVAAALARVAARRGLRTLVCEMDAKGDLARAFGVDELQFQASELSPGLFGMAMDTEQSLREYLRLFVKIPFVTSIGPLASTLDFVADAAPGVKEVLAVGKLCWEVREKRYDIVIVDAEASGHIVSQIAAPRVLQQLVRLGLIREQSDWMLDILENPEVTTVIAVTTPEEMPVTETAALLEKVRRDTRVDVGGIIVNRCPEPLFDGHLAATLDNARAHREELTNRFGHEADIVLRMAEFHALRRREAESHIATLAELCGEVPHTVVPDIVVDGVRVIDAMADVLDEELS